MLRMFLLALTLASGAVVANEGMIEQAKRDVAYDLRDPAAAQFREVKYYFKKPKKEGASGMHVVCGEVNGKNAYGAYTGFKRFFWYDGGSPMIRPDRKESADAWDALSAYMCADE